MNFKKMMMVIVSSMALFTTMNLGSLVNVDTTATEVASAKTRVYKSKLSKANQKAKAWIAYRESRGSYTVRNGIYIGRYQLTRSYLKGDYSKYNQEVTADRYVKNRYGSWVNAKRHWQYYGWY
ncbi:aggregation promoting factor surface protein [Lentilactobacillus senioris]|nr:aggregation promoting factor surface protein [Lentilactobacillus senioris]MCY9806284.1 aggregation promoting factor surface protein [Lentilactobacillus senioris]